MTTQRHAEPSTYRGELPADIYDSESCVWTFAVHGPPPPVTIVYHPRYPMSEGHPPIGFIETYADGSRHLHRLRCSHMVEMEPLPPVPTSELDAQREHAAHN